MISVNLEECEASGIDHTEIKKILKGLEKYCKKATSLGVYVFGSGLGLSLRYDDIKAPAGEVGLLELGSISGILVDGGDGGTDRNYDGLERGEC